MKAFKRDGQEYVALTQEELKRCFALLDGEATPSDFGYDITEAALLLAFFAMTMEKIPVNEIPPEHRARTKALIRDLKDMARTLGEAGKLAGEQKDD